ncbi:Transcription factor 23 [Halotydeus destructor]|nr:Transcription factor 23 [Halotydeus destructor]
MKVPRGKRPVMDETAKNAARERTRVRSLRSGFQKLQSSIPSIPADTKLSKLDILILATNYIAYLAKVLSEPNQDSPNPVQLEVSHPKYLRPVKKWPMRSRLYVSDKVESTDSSRSPSSLASTEDHHHGHQLKTLAHSFGHDLTQEIVEWDFLGDISLETNNFMQICEEVNVDGSLLSNIDIESLMNL